MPHVDVNGAALWVEEEGDGPAVLFVHGGLGDSASGSRRRMRSPRASGRSATTCASGAAPSRPEWSSRPVDDAIGVLDAIGVERAALVGLSLGGGLALDVTLAHPDRVWALAHVAAGVTGMPVDAVHRRAGDGVRRSGRDAGDLETMMEIDFAVWAPLGADDTMRELWQRDARRARRARRREARRPDPAHERLEEVAVPTLVIVPAHDPPTQREVGATVARRMPGAQLVEIDSDHYLTLREPSS